MLTPEPSSILYYFGLFQALDTNRHVASLAEEGLQQVVVLFQLHGCVVNHMQVLATPS